MQIRLPIATSGASMVIPHHRIRPFSPTQVPQRRSTLGQKRGKEHSMSDAKKESHTGTFLGVPYDWRRHGFKARLKQQWWNPAEPRLFTPKAFGWGYAVNLARLFRRTP